MAARRVSLPSADDLFRATKEAPAAPAPPAEDPESKKAREAGEKPAAGAPKRPSGRIRHDEKMTVYVTPEELLDLEHARLSLRREYGIAVDRGKLVRHAIAIALADLEANGGSAALIRRLTEG